MTSPAGDRYAADDESARPLRAPGAGSPLSNDGRLHVVDAAPAFTPGFDWEKFKK
jgi:hypothetical protein